MPSSPKFKSPPLEEVVCGVRFDLLDLSFQQLLGLWDLYKVDFPKAESAPRLQSGPTTIDLTGELPAPRLWFINEEDNRVVQVQNDYFIFNWRKRPPNDGYPDFDEIFGEFCGQFQKFEKFCAEAGFDPLNFQACELSYVNYIPKGVAWENFRDLGKIFTNFDFDHSTREYLAELVGFGSSFGYRLPDDNGNVTATYNLAKRVEDDTTVIQLQLSAKGLGADKSWDDVLNWFKIAHDHIVFGFCELTTPEAQEKLWERTK